MKFGQLLEYKTRNIFFSKNHQQNMVGKLFPNHFLKKSISVDKLLKILFSLFLIVCQFESYRNIIK